MLDDVVQTSTNGSVALRHFEPPGTSPLRHPNEIDWHARGRGWPGLKHAYSILWRREVLAGGGPIFGSRNMALILHCGWGTETDRISALESMGLVEVLHGSSVYAGAEEDVANEYRVVLIEAGPECDVGQQVRQPDVFKQYTRVEELVTTEDLYRHMDLLPDIAPPPDQDRWRQQRLGPVAWLMAADPLAAEPFTVREMADRLGLGVKAVRTPLGRMQARGLAQDLGRGRFQLRVPVEMPPGDRDEAMAHLSHDEEALKALMRMTTDNDTSLSDQQEQQLVGRLMERADASTYAQLEMRLTHPGRTLNGDPLLPAWVAHYRLTRRGWILRDPVVLDEWGMPWLQPVVPLRDTLTYEPRPGADQPHNAVVASRREAVEPQTAVSAESRVLTTLGAWRASEGRRAPLLSPHEHEQPLSAVQPW